MGADSRLRRRDAGGERWLARSRDTSRNSERRLPVRIPHSCKTPCTTRRSTSAAARRRRAGRPRRIAAAIDAYGAPEEVAEAYRQAEDTVAAALRRPKPAAHKSAFGQSPIGRFFGVIVDPTAYAAMFYALLALVTGIIYFTVVTVGISLDARAADPDHRDPARAAVHRDDPRDLARRGPDRRRVCSASGCRGGRGWPGCRATCGSASSRGSCDYRTWTTMLYMVLQLPLGIIYFTLMVTGLCDVAGARRLADHPACLPHPDVGRRQLRLLHAPRRTSRS